MLITDRLSKVIYRSLLVNMIFWNALLYIDYIKFSIIIELKL